MFNHFTLKNLDYETINITAADGGYSMRPLFFVALSVPVFAAHGTG